MTAPSDSVAQNPKTARLLIVDDDPAVSDLLARISERLGFTVFREASGRSALAAIPWITPDGIILDVRLGDLDGISILRDLTAAAPDTQVIVITGAPEVQAEFEAKEMGALGYLAKPIDVPRLRELLLSIKNREVNR